MYHPVTDGWNRFLVARECLPDSVLIACGDIRSPQDAFRLAELCHVDGIAVARGLLEQPSLLRDIEAAILGEPPVPTDDKLRFLLDITMLSGRLPKANNGFILRLARSMFGEESDVFKQLATCKTIAASAEWLRNRTTNGHE
jgi:tRNA-dihydrouridine synthase